MKKIILAIVVLLSGYNAISSPVKDSPVTVLNTTLDVFYFKVCKTMVGGTAEVFDAAGNLVASQNLENRKMIIDFFEMMPGDYTIKIKKDNAEETFVYHRNEYAAVASTDVLKLQTIPGK